MIRMTLLYFVLSCTSTKDKQSFDRQLDRGDCDRAYESLKKREEEFVVHYGPRRVLGSLLSYTVTGLGYITDGVLLIGEGLVSGLVYCTPAMILSTIEVSGSGAMYDVCGRLAGFRMGQYNGRPTYGAKVYEETSSLRCKDYSRLQDAVDRLRECYQKRSAVGDTERLIQLDQHFYHRSCWRQ